MRFSIICGMALRDYWHERALSLCAVLALATVLAPLLILFGFCQKMLVKSIALGREKYGLPEREEPLRTHFLPESVSLFITAKCAPRELYT